MDDVQLETRMSRIFKIYREFECVQWRDIKEDEEIYYLIPRHNDDALYGPFYKRGEFIENRGGYKLPVVRFPNVEFWRLV